MFTLLTSGVKPCRLFSRRNFPAARARSITVTVSQFPDLQQLLFFSPSWKFDGYRPGWKLKYQYLKCLDLQNTHSRNKNEPNTWNKNFFRIKWGKVLLQNSNSDIQLPNFSLFGSTSQQGCIHHCKILDCVILYTNLMELCFVFKSFKDAYGWTLWTVHLSLVSSSRKNTRSKTSKIRDTQ